MRKFNKDILFMYSEHARIKIKNIAQALKKSSQRIKYNLKVIERENIVHDPYTIIDYSFLGLLLFRVYFKGGYISEHDKLAIIKKLSGNPYVVSIYELGGEFDLAIEMEFPNPSRFNKELKKIITIIPMLNNYKIVMNIVTHIYPRYYLTKSAKIINMGLEESYDDIIIGGDRAIENFSIEEMSVLKNILTNPKIHLTKLAKNSNLNIKTSNLILKDLHKRSIVKGYKHVLDTNALGIHKHRLFLKLRNLSQEREAQLGEYLKNTSEIVQMNKTIGDWDMEIDIEAFDKSRIRYLITHLRENFTDLIENFNRMEFYQYYKLSMLPAYIFEQETRQGS